jgi:hypothetical protein
MTWAILIFTALMLVWVISGANAAGQVPVANDAEAAGVAIGTGLAVTFLFFIWFVGFIVLSIVWFMTRARHNVVAYGPGGQQVMFSEKEAKKRVEKQGWSYQPKVLTGPPASTPLLP